MLLIALSFLQAAMNLGQAVEIQDYGASDWSPGRIVGVQRQSDGLHYRVEHKRGNFTVETDYPAAMVRGAGNTDISKAAPTAPFAIGDKVEIRDHASDQWQAGEVVGIDPIGAESWRYRVRYQSVAGEVENVFYADRIRPAGRLTRSAAAPARAAPGQVVPGAYACTHDYWTGAMPYRQRHSDPVGTLTLSANGTYRWLSNGGGGSYRLGPGGTLTFVSGPIAAKQPKSANYRVNQRTTQVDISFADGFDWSCGHNL